VLGELLPNGSYAYPIGVVLFPRQTGKTTFVMDVALGRCLMYPDYRCAYAAQTGHVTTERMVERMAELADGPLASRVRMRRSAGTERVTLPGRSYVKAFPPKAGALRSNALDLVMVDEAQEHGTVLGQQLDLTILPTFSTRPRRQLILIGTAGTDASDYLLRYLGRSRAKTPGYCVIEYGALEGEDIEDETLWEYRHPGIAAGLTDAAYLRSMRAAMGFAGFGREFFNVWSRTTDRSIDPADWAAVQDPAAAVTGDTVALGFEVDPGRGSAAIAIADTNGAVELVDQHDGTDWLTARLLGLQTTHGYPIACTRYGAAGPTVDTLEAAGATLVTLSSGDAQNACGSIADAIRDRTLKVRPSPALTESVEGAAQREIADTGGFVWARRDAASNPAPLIAATWARWGATHGPDRRRPVATMGTTTA
jgi:hypothetical protein